MMRPPSRSNTEAGGCPALRCLGAHRALCPRCAKVGYFDPFSPMAKVTAVTTLFPDTGLLTFLPSPNTQIMR